MTGKDLGYYALAVALFLATVPLYHYIIEHEGERAVAPDPGTPLNSRPLPDLAARRSQPEPVLQARNYPEHPGGGIDRVTCKDGLLVWHQADQSMNVTTPNGSDFARCEIQVEPVHPDSSPATD